MAYSTLRFSGSLARISRPTAIMSAVRFSLIAASSAAIWAGPSHFLMKSAYWPVGYFSRYTLAAAIALTLSAAWLASCQAR